MIQVENLVKKFGDFTAVDNISFEVRGAKSSRSSDPTAPEKPLRSRCLLLCFGLRAGRFGWTV